MKKLVVLAALAAASFAAPVAPVQAASEYAPHCYVMPLLKDCRGVYTSRMKKADKVSVSVTVAAKSERVLPKSRWPIPYPWNCTRAPAGSKYLYDCD